MKNPPEKTGLYIVAEFVDNELKGYAKWARINEPKEPQYWGPNDLNNYGREHYTHYMSMKEFKDAFASLPRE